MTLSPAQTVIHEFGGVRATAKALQRSPGTISRWTAPKAEGGTGGLVPSNLQADILRLASERGIYLTADEIIHGRTYSDE